MAQKKTSRSSGSGSRPQPTSTARVPGDTKKKSTSSSSRSSSSKSGGSKSTGAKSSSSRNSSARNNSKSSSRGSSQTRKTPSPKSTAKMPPMQEREPMGRKAGAIGLLFLGLVAFISLLPTQGVLVDAFESFIRGLFGWGSYLVPVVLWWGAYVLGFHRDQPVAIRLACILLFPVMIGAFIHTLLCPDPFFASGVSAGLRDLWDMAQIPAYHCGGVLAGILSIMLKSALSKIGAYIVLIVAFCLMLIKALNIPFQSVLDLFKNLPPLFRTAEDEEEVQPEKVVEQRTSTRNYPKEDYFFPLDGSEPIPRTDKKPVRQSSGRQTQKTAGQKQTRTSGKNQIYDLAREDRKDQIFAEFEIDPVAAKRMASALREEKKKTAQNKQSRSSVSENTVKQTGTKNSGSVKTEAVSPTKDVKPLTPEEAADIAGVDIQAKKGDAGAKAPRKEKIDKDAEAAAVAADIASAEQEEKTEYIYPNIELLNKSTVKASDNIQLDENEAQLEAAIRSFGVGASIVGAVHGPSITRYELKLDQGVKLNKITNLAGDIALSLGVSNVRIAPIPDKISTVGVEVPNRHVQTVWLGDVIDSEVFRNSKSKLSVAMGKDIGGNVIVGNIAKMPHVLIAGTTGSGKSVCVNSMILSLLYKSTPDEVRMIMIDPKMVEFGIYNGMPHLYVPVVTDPKKAAGALQWAVVEMLKRYRLFSELGVRDLEGYNAILAQNDQPALPRVVIFIDELADLMMVASKEVEESICRVAQMGRAAGMHLVVATQRPSADVITGLMKANIPSRIALSVSSSLESRIILDQQGAEKLVGNGDMLYAPIGRKPTRVQGAFVTDEEREDIINFVKSEAEAQYSDEIMTEIEKASADKSEKGSSQDEGKQKNEYDELLPQAVDVIFETKQASVSMLQRRLKLGYSRAARLIDQLEELGVVGPYEGSKPRQIVITKQQWQEMQYAQGTAPVDSIAQEFAEVSGNEAYTDEEDAAEGEVSEADHTEETENEMPSEELSDETGIQSSSEEDISWQEDDE